MDVRAIVRGLATAGALSFAFLAACQDDPTSSGRGDPLQLIVDRTTTFQSVGASFTIRARVEDRYGNRLDPTMIGAASSNAAVVRVDSVVAVPELGEARAFLTAVSMGAARVTFSGGGLTATTDVTLYPASLMGVAADTLGSGESVQITVLGLTTAGTSFGEVAFTVTNPGDTLVASVTPEGLVTAKAPGATAITVTGPGGEITTTINIVVVPGTFDGTVSAGARNTGDVLTITAGTIAFDADTEVWFGHQRAFIVSQSATQIQAVIPYSTTEPTFLLTKVGPGQLALEGSFTAGTLTGMDPWEPNEDETTAPIITIPGTYYASVHPGDDWYDFYRIVVPAQASYTFHLQWLDDADVDMYLLQNGVLNVCADDFFGCAAATGANPESRTVTLGPGTYELLVDLWEGVGQYTTYRLRVTQN
jgi:hypothetical protein